MARFYATRLIPDVIDAAGLFEAELIATQRYGAEFARCISALDLEQDRLERSAGNRRRARKPDG